MKKSSPIARLLLQAISYPNQNIPKRTEASTFGQHPEVAVLCCSDSRVIPEEIFDCSIGDIFVIRTAGNTLGPNEFASFGYAYHHLHIHHFIVLGHTKCGAIASTLKGEERNCIFDAIASHIGDEHEPEEASKKNALGVVKELKEQFNDVEVVALLYDVTSGEVHEIA